MRRIKFPNACFCRLIAYIVFIAFVFSGCGGCGRREVKNFSLEIVFTQQATEALNNIKNLYLPMQAKDFTFLPSPVSFVRLDQEQKEIELQFDEKKGWAENFFGANPSFKKLEKNRNKPILNKTRVDEFLSTPASGEININEALQTFIDQALKNKTSAPHFIVYKTEGSEDKASIGGQESPVIHNVEEWTKKITEDLYKQRKSEQGKKGKEDSPLANYVVLYNPPVTDYEELITLKIPPVIDLQINPIHLVRDPTAPPVISVTVSGRISVNYPPVTLLIIEPKSQQRKIEVGRDGRFSITVRFNPSSEIIRLQATDGSGKIESKTAEIIYREPPVPRIDLQINPIHLVRDPTAPPVISVTVSGRVSVNYPPVTLRIIQPESQQREIEVGRNGGFSTTVNFNPSSERIQLQATDSLNNNEIKTAEIIYREPRIGEPPIIVDTISPQIQVSPLPPFLTQTSIELTGRVIDENLEELLINDKMVTPDRSGEFRETVSGLKAGPQNPDILIKATDIADNLTTVLVKIPPVDLEPPKIEVIDPPQTTPQTVKVGESVKIAVKATDDAQVTRVKISGKGVEAEMKLDEETGQYKHEFTTTNEQIGDLSLSVTAFDLVPNRPSESKTITVEVEGIDTTPPTFASRDRLSSLTKSSDRSYSLTRYIEDGDFYVKVSDADSGIREVRLNNSAIEGTEGLYLIKLAKLREESDGKLTGLLIAVDKAGEDGNQAKLQITVDVGDDIVQCWREVYIFIFLEKYDEAEVSLNEIAKERLAPTPEVNLFLGIIRYHQGAKAGSDLNVALQKFNKAVELFEAVKARGRDVFPPGSDFFHDMRYYLGMSYYGAWFTKRQLNRIDDANLRGRAEACLSEFISLVTNDVGRYVLRNRREAERILRLLE